MPIRGIATPRPVGGRAGEPLPAPWRPPGPEPARCDSPPSWASNRRNQARDPGVVPGTGLCTNRRATAAADRSPRRSPALRPGWWSWLGGMTQKVPSPCQAKRASQELSMRRGANASDAHTASVVGNYAERPRKTPPPRGKCWKSRPDSGGDPRQSPLPPQPGVAKVEPILTPWPADLDQKSFDRDLYIALQSI
jgi:hypothetical protein